MFTRKECKMLASLILEMINQFENIWRGASRRIYLRLVLLHLLKKYHNVLSLKNFVSTLLIWQKKKATEDDTTEIRILKEAATILRRKALQHIKKDPSTFQGSIEASKTNCNELNTFLKWVVTGEQLLNDNLYLHAKIQSQTITSNILYNTKSERQVKYCANESDESVSAYLLSSSPYWSWINTSSL